MDRLGFISFVDRMGDTFRWKGENVSTCQVQLAVLQAAPDLVEEALAFGVRPPLSRATHGKCGMLALVLRRRAPATWPDDLFRLLRAHSGLPDFALPRFLRVVQSLPKTATHKYLKATFLADALDPAKVYPDPVFVLDTPARAYVPYDDTARDRLASGDLRL